MKRIALLLLVFLAACVLAADTPAPPLVPGICYLTDFPDLQAAVDGCANGGTVIIPAGIHEIGTVNLNNNSEWQKVITIQGAGHGHLGQAPGQGSSQWDYLLNHPSGLYHYGTVLRGHFVISHRLNSVYFRDFAMIGHGTGIAINYGDGVNMFPEGGMENISIGNYDIGIRLRRSYYMSIDDVSMAGVGVGLQNIDSNVITVSGLNIATCGTGLDVTGNGNSYYGGSMQTCDTGAILGGFGSTLTSFYFEQLTNSLIVPGRGHSILSNYYAGNSGAITISGHNNYLYTSETVTPVQVTGNYNRIDLSAYGSCNDSGFANECNSPYP